MCSLGVSSGPAGESRKCIRKLSAASDDGTAEMSRSMACFRPATATRVAQMVSVFNRLTFTTCIHCGGSRHRRSAALQ